MFLFVLALAGAQPAAPAPVPPADKADPNKVICHLESSASSRIPDRICHTRAEWEQIEKDTRDDIKDAHRFGNYGDPTPH